MSKRFTGKRKEHVVKGEKQTITKKDVGTVKVDGEQPKQEAQAERKPVVIKVLKHDAKFRGAREAWYNRLKEFDGKPLDDYIEDCKKNCPQLTKNGTVEPPTGWVGWFKRNGIMQEVNQ
jgi:hypothetical protein